MRSNYLNRLVLAAAVLPFAFATASQAQDRPGGGRPPMEHRDPAARAAAHAQHLRDALQLRPDQEGALHAFLDAVAPPGDEHGRMDADRDGEERLTTPERLDHMLAHMDAMRSAMVARVEATKRFYGQLSPSQQRAFDAMKPMGMGHHHGMGGGHGGWRGHMGDGGGGPDGAMGEEGGPPPPP
jgi:hypothetical protein